MKLSFDNGGGTGLISVAAPVVLGTEGAFGVAAPNRSASALRHRHSDTTLNVTSGHGWVTRHVSRMPIRDVIFRKMTNLNQTDTNEKATTETKYQTDF